MRSARFERELAAARERNLVRTSGVKGRPKDRSDYYIMLRPFEVATLRATGAVSIKRAIWPPEKLSVPYCYFAYPGTMYRVHEEIKYIGASPTNALYVYRGDEGYNDVDLETWTRLRASKMPAKAVRFWVLVLSTVRPALATYWLIDLKRVEKSDT